MTTLENKEIRGITNRLMVVIICSVVSLTSGGVAFYLGLINKINMLSQKQESRKIEVDIQFKDINEKIDGVKEDMRYLKETKR